MQEVSCLAGLQQQQQQQQQQLVAHWHCQAALHCAIQCYCDLLQHHSLAHAISACSAAFTMAQPEAASWWLLLVGTATATMWPHRLAQCLPHRLAHPAALLLLLLLLVLLQTTSSVRMRWPGPWPTWPSVPWSSGRHTPPVATGEQLDSVKLGQTVSQSLCQSRFWQQLC
jgi:hypothetical protein